MKIEKLVVLKKQTEFEIVDILCNKCGKSTKRYYTRLKDLSSYVGIIEYDYHGEVLSGNCYDYNSKLLDGVSYRFSLCEDCLSELFDSFLIPVEQTQQILSDKAYKPSSLESYEPNYQQKLLKIYNTTSSESLVEYLTDSDQRIRKFAKVQFDKICDNFSK